MFFLVRTRLSRALSYSSVLLGGRRFVDSRSWFRRSNNSVPFKQNTFGSLNVMLPSFPWRWKPIFRYSYLSLTRNIQESCLLRSNFSLDSLIVMSLSRFNLRKQRLAFLNPNLIRENQKFPISVDQKTRLLEFIIMSNQLRAILPPTRIILSGMI